MAVSSAFEKLPRFGTALFTLVLSALVCGLGIGALTLMRYSNQLERTVQTRMLQRSTLAMQDAMNSVINRQWDSLSSLAASLDLGSVQKMSTLLDAAPQFDAAIGWAAVVAPSGQILAATEGQQTGADVSGLNWFRNGLQKRIALPAAGERAVMLAEPILRGGETEGVLVYRLKLDALADLLRPIAAQLGEDAFIVDPNGRMVLAAASLGRPALSPAELGALRQGQGDQSVQALGSGALISVSDWSAGAHMPYVAWKLVLRSPDRLHAGLLDHAKAMAVLTYLGLGALVAVILTLWILRNARQLSELSHVAVRMAKGELICPPDYHATREAAQLSSALVQMQTQINDLRAMPRASRKPQLVQVEKYPVSAFGLRSYGPVTDQ
ncbi:HAMP domain-containing protein [Thioclava sp. BHET1]|nr:HAMP domain-containing protein [Thioclava sp. BHET1]